MINKFKNILKILVVLFIIFWTNISLFAGEESANINWEKGKISKVYNESTKKLIFLVQFKTTKEPNIDYDYYFRILTNKRKRTCEWKFIYNWAKTIYATCSVIIGDIKTLDKKINLNFEVEDPENHENQIVVNRNYNIFNNISSFDWILDTDEISEIKTPAQVVDLDVLDTPKTTVEKLKKQWKIVIWYINIWAIENYRDDYEKFPKNVIWKTYSWWEDEKYLDVRKYEKFQKFILNRLEIAKEKGFNWIEPDNMDTYDNFEETWFKILEWDMREYLTWLNIETNKRWMFLIQKNAPELSKKMEKNFDAALLEWAFYNNFEDDFKNYIKNWKKVFNVEYTYNTSKKFFLENICTKSKKLWFISILKNRDLDEFILECPIKKDKNKNLVLEKKLNIKLDKIILKLNKKYSQKKLEKIYKKILEKIRILENNKKYKNKVLLLENIKNRFNLELNKISWQK